MVYTFTSAPTQSAQAWLAQVDAEVAALGIALNTDRVRSLFLGSWLDGEAREWFEGYLFFEEQFPSEPSLLDSYARLRQDFLARFT
jgi:hypothetical protein